MIKDILEMIEKCDPADSAGLDEIDVMVFSYINGIDYIKEGYKKYYELIFLPKYTRSRDALKSIRPEGWYYSSGYRNYKSSYWAQLTQKPTNLHSYQFVSLYLPNEELAELYVILSAIEHERGLK